MNKTIYEMMKDTEKMMNGSSVDMVESYYTSTEYIMDAINEHADSMIDIYTSNLMDWASNNFWAIDEAMDELGCPGSFVDIVRQGQYYQYSRDMYEDQGEICKLSALRILSDEIENGLELTDEQIDEIMDEIADEYDTFDQIADALKEAIESVKCSDDE